MGRYYQKYFEDYEENRVPNKWETEPIFSILIKAFIIDRS